MTGQERDYEAVLSRVLHTTTDQFEPVGDGLTKIRARLSEPWLRRQWWLLRSEFMVLRWLVVVRCESFFSTVRSRFTPAESTPANSAADPLAPLIACSTPDTKKHARRLRSRRSVLGGITAWAASMGLGITAWAASMGPGRGHKDGPRSPYGPVMNWLRPALAVAGAVVLVVAGVFALGSIRATVVGLENATGTNTSNSGPGNGTGNPNGSGNKFPASRGPSQGQSGAVKPGAGTAQSKTGASPRPCTSPSVPPNSPSPSPSPTSPSPSPTPTSPSPTPTPTSASPTPSISQAPFIGGVPGPTQEAIGTTALVMCAPTPVASPSNQATSGP
ncbi:MAG TPA: hypothetical protein VGI05_14510 [Streptosporangiaceae bacterium]|jgi:hypothetical protein